MKKLLLILLCVPLLFSCSNEPDWICESGNCEDGDGVASIYSKNLGNLNYRKGYWNYTGEFKNGKPNGKGIIEGEEFTRLIGDSRTVKVRYKGEFKDGKRNGIGSQTHYEVDEEKLLIGLEAKEKILSIYKGEWLNNRKHGTGSEVWLDNSFIKTGKYAVEYIGDYKDGKFSGKGTMSWGEDSEYVGEWKKGWMHGKGIRVWNNGDKYEGDWQEGVYYGIGTLVKGKKIQSGKWINGEFFEIEVNNDYKEFFLNACNGAFQSEKELKMNHFKDNNSDDFCGCWTEKVFDNFTASELEKIYNDATSSNNDFYDASYQVFNNPIIQEITIDCMEDEVFADDSYIELNPEKLSVFVKQCKDNLQKELSSDDYYNFNLSVNIDEYCECLMTNLLSEFNINEMMSIDENPKDVAKRDEIMTSCIEIHAK